MWQNKREAKVESFGDNVFMFKFGTKIEKEGINKSAWAFIVFTEPKGIGDMSKQSFTNVSFWVQLQNVPIMCMDRETILELGEAINITKPLMKILEIRQEDINEEEDIRVLIRYERLPDFCYCYGCIGHQYRKCTRYEKQLKEDIQYGP